MSSSAPPPAEPLLFVLVGPGGVGKGTVAGRLIGADLGLWLSRSWTTRPRRPGEPEDAYVFVDRATFEAKVAEGGFLEWAEFLGNCYGTPLPEPPAPLDVLLEIEVQGATQVLERRPDACLILLLPPSDAAQEARLRGRGDDDAHVEARLRKGAEEVAQARALGALEVINDDLDTAVAEVAAIVEALRTDRDGRSRTHRSEDPPHG